MFKKGSETGSNLLFDMGIDIIQLGVWYVKTKKYPPSAGRCKAGARYYDGRFF
jgi:hypothetical protein